MRAGEQTLPALLNMNAFRILCQDLNLELGDLDTLASRNALEFVPQVMWAGVRNWALYKDKPAPQMSFERFAALLLADPEAIPDYAETIGEAMGLADPEPGK